MHYLVLSFTHKNTTLPIRDKLAFNDDETKVRFLERTLESPYLNEAIVLSTCNRIELIVSCNNLTEAAKHLFLLLNEHSGIGLNELEGRAELFEDQGAIHHLFSVASSLDSLIVGETQIAGMLVGLAGAAEYEELTDAQFHPSARENLVLRGCAQLLLVAIVVASGMRSLIRRSKGT